MTNTELLERVEVALNDWVHQYAPELCDNQKVRDSAQRIGEVGTLAYIGNLLVDVRKELRELRGGER